MDANRSAFGAWILTLGLGLAAAKPSSAQSGSWLGQDGHDLVGPSSVQEPSGVQDIRIALRGLPSSAIDSATIRGLGGDEWQVDGPFGPWKAALVRSEEAPSADLFLEPSRAETGRPFTIELRFVGGRSAAFDVRGGRADPNLRMPGAALKATWIGPDGRDRVGIGPSVGPDGLQDATILLANLSKRIEIASASIDVPGLVGWESGRNPKGRNNAEIVRKADDSRAELTFQPDADLSGKSLRVRIAYTNGKLDSATVVAGRMDPKLAMPNVTAPSVEFVPLKSRWIGQDGSAEVGSGDVHVVIDGLPRIPAIAAALSDPGTGCWVWRSEPGVAFDVGIGAENLAYRQGADPSRADLHFPPLRDESGGSMTLRVLLKDGRTIAARFPGGPADPVLRTPGPSATRGEARPGDDLNELASRVGNLHLSAGEYRLDRPVILPHAIAITADPGVTLRFRQPAGSPPWTTAIKVHSGRTSLDGFAVRFHGPVRWDWGVSGGPAVIGGTDDRDGGNHPLKVGVSLTGLDLEGPPTAKPLEPVPSLIRFLNLSGKIERNRLKGGSMELWLGPWSVKKNVYRGTVANTTCPSVISVHYTHDLAVEENRTTIEPDAGKTWRFLVMTGGGTFDSIRGNVVEGIGQRDGDGVPDQNSPEIILTEAYCVHFEGMPTAVSADGRILAIPPPQDIPARSGDIVSILSGPEAGRFRRIAQVLGPLTYLLDEPLPPGRFPISISSGFVGETFEGNRIDIRGSSGSTSLVLVGNHFGTRVIGNHFLGGGDAWFLSACPTEGPVAWGWTHAPMLGLVIEGNTLEDAHRGGTISVPHDPPIKSSRGRVYATANLRGNVIRWSDGFVRRAGEKKEPLVGLRLGHRDSLDPGELLLTVSGNRVDGPSAGKGALMLIDAATINGRAAKNAWVKGSSAR